MKLRKKYVPAFGMAIFAAFSCAAFFADIKQCMAVFTDVQPLNRYYTAVEYLSSAGIVNGYPDGTFLPEKTVNRAEFLKLVLESSGVPADVTVSSGFTDVDESAWYAKYIRKALKEGWVEGYTDKTFRPENGITKAEGLKMIGEVQNWQTDGQITDPPFADTPETAWFTPYVAYAKSKNYLEETGRFFVPEMILTRGNTGEILFRSYVTALSGADAYSSKLSPALAEDGATHGSAPSGPVIPPPPEMNFTPVVYQNHPADSFNNVTLKETFPNTFYMNEVYFFEGAVNSGYYDKAFIFLAPEGVQDTTRFNNNIGTVNGTSLRIPVVFREPGNYRMGLILGSSGESRVVDISVLPSLPAPSSSVQTPSPSNPRIEYKNLKTTASWDGKEDRLIQLHIFQGNRTRSYVSRQGTGKLDIPYGDFNNFSEGPAYYLAENAGMASKKPLKISGGWSASAAGKFSAVGHHFSEYDKTMINVSTLHDTYTEGQGIRLSGSTKTAIYADFAVTMPDGKVELIRISSSKPFGEYYDSKTVPASGDFSFTYKTILPGTYFIEINSLDGEAVLNHPIYPKESIPLLPDFFDMGQYEQKEDSFNLSEFRIQLLNLINTDRRSAGLPEVSADPALNNLAQLHSDDMVERNFFGHINPDGETPNDRRIKFSLPAPVGENLAQAPTILYTHYGLMRSGIHRKNILDPAWTLVGIGITKNKDGQLYVTEEFSTGAITEIELINIEKRILEEINIQRKSGGIPLLETDSTLSQVADAWSAKMASLNFFDFVSPNGETLYGLVRNKISNRSVQAVILESSTDDRLIEEAMSGNDATEKTWSKIGIGVKADKIGTLKATLLYTTAPL